MKFEHFLIKKVFYRTIEYLILVYQSNFVKMGINAHWLNKISKITDTNFISIKNMK